MEVNSGVDLWIQWLRQAHFLSLPPCFFPALSPPQKNEPARRLKTATERSRLYRKKLQEGSSDKYEDYKKKDRERRKRQERKRNYQQECRLKKERYVGRGWGCIEKEKETRIFRILKLLYKHPKIPHTRHLSHYFGKAIHKVKKALPKSPRKKKAVLHKLASTVHLDSSETIESPTVSSNRKLPADSITKVQQFFLRDSVSRQAPGIHSYVIVQQEGKKIKLQKRHLVLSLWEVHALFVNEFPEVEISLGKFCSLRPDVLVFSKMPRNVCLFQHHDNVNLLCSSLHKVQWNPVNTTTNGPKYSGRINGVGSLSMMREQFNYFDVMSTLAN